jgi:hypothetical protein
VLNEQRAEEIIALIDELDIHDGIFEEYDRLLSYFTEVEDFTWLQPIYG